VVYVNKLQIINYTPKYLDENSYQCNIEEKHTCTQCNFGYELIMGECKVLPKVINNICYDNYYLSIFTDYVIRNVVE